MIAVGATMVVGGAALVAFCWWVDRHVDRW
jgi:hypothetical protein